ncbi:MAG: NAD(P)/FAD-dependent oxidoreductase [Saprospiraceae bacterium]|nr:NAD(P)/FAD-dependent oxidoreductase [Saprospiraceae bacterium]
MNTYDVLIPGCGLAGLTLALQLKRENPAISILVIEKRDNAAPVATHKVGESISEIAACYLREKLDLAKYLDEKQLLKYGLRFFFSPQNAGDLSMRVEVGTRIDGFNPTHQLDRGILENDLSHLSISIGVEIIFGAVVRTVHLSPTKHTVVYEKENKNITVFAKWIVDTSGRSSLLKRKLELQKPLNHQINAVWFRLDHEIDIDEWSNNLIWRNKVPAGRRRLATNHLMGEGYWVWLIPLISGATSVGIVADPAYHPFETFNTFEKAMIWLAEHEPLAFKMLSPHKGKKMDFKSMKNLAYGTQKFFSKDRWAITGEAGAFMDPFYSPGSDFIALGNTWTADLILRELRGEDITLRSMIYELTINELFDGWTLIYQNKYGLFGNSQIMLMKIIWDWATYWSVPAVLFVNDGYTNIAILKEYSSSSKSIGKRFNKLNEKMQMLFKDWSGFEQNQYANFHGNLFELNFLRKLQLDLHLKYTEDRLIEKLESNVNQLERLASEIFRKLCFQINQTPADLRVNPYEMSLSDSVESLYQKANHPNAFEIHEQIKSDIEKMWLVPEKLKIEP